MSTKDDEHEGLGIAHHERVQDSFNLKSAWWKEQTDSKYRCRNCWLRHNECYCTQIDDMKIKAEEITHQISNTAINFIRKINIKVCMYYHYQEIGRSANTAHLFDAICNARSGISPFVSNNSNVSMFNESEVIVFGDSTKEIELLTQINHELVTNDRQTCILYPTPTCKLISEWVIEQINHSISSIPSSSGDIGTNIDNSTHKITNHPSDINLRLVVLDGTYPQASRLYKYLSKSLKGLFGDDKELPLVKLDLGVTGTCRSALLGIQSQPGVDKLCSYQAVIMAMQQAEECFYQYFYNNSDGRGTSSSNYSINDSVSTNGSGSTNSISSVVDIDNIVSDSNASDNNNINHLMTQIDAKYKFMSTCLDKWLQHMLNKKIKLGKRDQRFKLDFEPADYVKEFLHHNPPPTNEQFHNNNGDNSVNKHNSNAGKMTKQQKGNSNCNKATHKRPDVERHTFSTVITASSTTTTTAINDLNNTNFMNPNSNQNKKKKKHPGNNNNNSHKLPNSQSLFSYHPVRKNDFIKIIKTIKFSVFSVVYM